MSKVEVIVVVTWALSEVLLDARFGDAARLKWFAELSDARQPLAPNLN